MLTAEHATLAGRLGGKESPPRLLAPTDAALPRRLRPLLVLRAVARLELFLCLG